MKQNIKKAIGMSLSKYHARYMKATNDRIDNITAQAGTDNTEIVDARIDTNGVKHTTLNNRIKAEAKIGDEQLVPVSGTYITQNGTMKAPIDDIEIIGNTYQDPNNLSRIVSVGEEQEDGQFKMSILSSNKNLCPSNFKENTAINFDKGEEYSSSGNKAIIDYIKIKPNTNYKCYSDSANLWIVYYDISKNVIKGSGQIWSTFTSPSNCHYVRLYVRSSDTFVMLEEGNKTSYVPHEEHKSSILLPCALGNGDRLYHDGENWCIDKSFTKVVDFLSWSADFNASLVNTYRISLKLPKILPNYTLFSNKLHYVKNYSLDEPHFYEYSSLESLCIFLPKVDVDKFEGNVTERINKYLESVCFYVNHEPTKIILPKDQQITLNSFADKTHIYMISGEVEGTIKAKVSKSMGASVSANTSAINGLDKRVADIEGLKESQDMAYETDKGYLVCEGTKNGVVKDLELKGTTLVNKSRRKNFDPNNLSGRSLQLCGEIVKTYTIKCDVISNFTTTGIKLDVCYEDDTHSYRLLVSGGNTGVYAHTFNETKSVKSLTIYQDSTDFNEGKLCVVDNIILMESDKISDNVNGYFEGLKSVGDDVDEIAVLSVNENLFDGVFEKGYLNSTTGAIIPSDSGRVVPMLKVNPGSTISVNIHKGNSDRQNYAMFDINKKFIGYGGSGVSNIKHFTIDVPINCHYMNIYVGQNATSLVELVSINYGTTPKPYEPHQSNKKPLLYRDTDDTFKPTPQLREWDKIEDSKLIVGSGQVVLNGSENIQLDNLTNDKSTFKINAYANTIKAKLGTSLSNNEIISNGVFEQISCGKDGNLYFRCNESYASTVNVIKQKLQANNVTVVYQLATQQIYDLAPIDLDAYENETLILCESGAISPHMNFKMTTHINNLIPNIISRVDNLEDEVFKVSTITNNINDVELPKTNNSLMVTQSAVDFLLMNTLGENKIIKLGGANMGAYLAMRIMERQLTYGEVVAKYPQFKSDIDIILKCEGYGHLIVE